MKRKKYKNPLQLKKIQRRKMMFQKRKKFVLIVI